MTKTILANNPHGDLSTVNATTYLSLYGSASFSGTEVNRQSVFPIQGTITNLSAYVSANNIVGTSTFRLRVNGANGNETVSIGSTSTGLFEDTTNIDGTTAGDKFNVSFVPGDAVNQLTLEIIHALFAAQSGRSVTHLGYGIATTVTLNQTFYWQFSGGQVATTSTESDAKVEVRRAGQFNNAVINITGANTISDASTYRFRKNGANGNMTISVPGLQTGFFQDSVNTDTVVVGDQVDSSFTAGTTGTDLVVRSISIEFEDKAGKDVDPRYGLAQNGAMPTVAFTRNTDTFQPIMGGFGSIGSTTEANSNIKTRAIYDFSDLSCVVGANDNSNAGTVRFRINGANGNNTLSITAATTGFFSDSTNVDRNVAAGSLVCHEIITGVGTGTQSTSITYFDINYLESIYSQMVFMGYFKAP